MATIKYFIKSSAKEETSRSNIYCRLRSGREIDLTAKSGVIIRADQFSNKTGYIKNVANATKKDKLNRDLRKLREFIFDELERTARKSEINKEWLDKTIDKYWNPDKYETKGNTLFTFISQFIEKAPQRLNHATGRPISYKMKREYERTFYYLQKFAESEKRVIDFKDIDLDFYNDFVEYLEGRGLALNTIGKKIQTLKIFMNAASEIGVNKNNSYKSPRFKSMKEESESIYLNEEELDRIFKLNLKKNPRLERVRDLFIVACWTGLRFSDIKQVTPKSINDNIITIKQSKTGGKVAIPVHPHVRTVLDKYDGELPDTISNQKFNDYLKEVAQLAKLNSAVSITRTQGGKRISKTYKKFELVKSHTGRRSFATNNYRMGVPSITIMAITGHKTEAAFLKYIKVTPTEHAEKIREFWQKRTALKAV